MKIKEVLDYLEHLAPGYLQEDYDNSGLLVGDHQQEVTGILVSLDCIESVVDEAIERKCNVIISHHPIVFSGLKRFTGADYIQRVIIKAIRNSIALISIHTNLDNVQHGVNKVICDRLGILSPKILKPKTGMLEKLVTYIPEPHLEEVRNALFRAGAGHIGEYSECSFSSVGQGTFTPSSRANPTIGQRGKREQVEEVRLEVLVEKWKRQSILQALVESHPYEEVAWEVYPIVNAHPQVGSGMIGKLAGEENEEAFAKWVKDRMKVPAVKHTAFLNRKVRKVAVCGGSGSFLLADAIKAGADVFISSDFKYHQYFDADGRIVILDIGHYESEQFTSEYLMVSLTEKFPNFAVHLSQIRTNPINFI